LSIFRDAIDYIRAFGNRRTIQRLRHERRLDSDSSYRDSYFKALALKSVLHRSYKNAGGREEMWKAKIGKTSADQHVLSSYQSLNNRGWEAQRDDSIGSGLVKRFERNVIGSELRPQAETGDENKDRFLESIWDSRKNDLDPINNLEQGEFQRLVFASAFIGGEVLVIPVVFPPLEGERRRLQFQIKESDFIGTPLGEQGKRNIVDGIERDNFGRKVAYWVSNVHPSRIGLSSIQINKEFKRYRVNEVVHVGFVDRSGQTRCVSRFHSVLQDLKDLDFLFTAGLQRLEIATALALIIESGEDLQSIMDQNAMPGLANETGKEPIESRLEPGAILGLRPGEKASTLIPNFPTPELFPFVRMIAMRIGSALGITWEEVLNNYADDNYSSARTGILESRVTYKLFHHWFTNRCMTPIWSWVMQDEFLRNPSRFDGINRDDLNKVRWVAPGKSWVDPQKEVVANIKAENAGHISLEEIYGARGLYWEDELRQIAKERRLREELGIPVVSDNGNTMINNPDSESAPVEADSESDEFVKPPSNG